MQIFFKKIHKSTITGCLFAAITAAGFMIMIVGAQENADPEYIKRPISDHSVTAATASGADKSAAGQSDAVITAEKPAGPVKITGYTGFIHDTNGTAYYSGGIPAENRFIYAAGGLYHVGSDGYLDTGWYQEKTDAWFYFDKDAGGKSQKGWIDDGGTWYYLEDGQYKTGWALLLDSEGKSWYYFDRDTGAMLSDCRTPDGYYVDENGRWAEDAAMAYDGEGFTWNKPTDQGAGQISGLVIAGMSAEFYMLSIAGETSGMSNGQAIINGDGGRAYGICQFDYRYDLVDFMQFAYGKHPELWPGFEGLLSYADGDGSLRNNKLIARTFLDAMQADYETAVNDQLEFVRTRYWDEFASQMDTAGFNLSGRHVAVSAAFLSVNVNCGAQAGVFIENLSPEMTDEELIRGIYRLRNTVFAEQYVGAVKKGTTARYLRCEPQMALDLLYGYTTIDSDVRYGGGVEWHGNPFADAVTTVELPGEISYAETELAEKADMEQTAEESSAGVQEGETGSRIATPAEAAGTEETVPSQPAG